MTCKHLNARLDSDSLASAVVCPECGKTVRIYQLVNNMLDAMQEAMEREVYPETSAWEMTEREEAEIDEPEN